MAFWTKSPNLVIRVWQKKKKSSYSNTAINRKIVFFTGHLIRFEKKTIPETENFLSHKNFTWDQYYRCTPPTVFSPCKCCYSRVFLDNCLCRIRISCAINPEPVLCTFLVGVPEAIFPALPGHYRHWILPIVIIHSVSISRWIYVPG